MTLLGVGHVDNVTHPGNAAVTRLVRRATPPSHLRQTSDLRQTSARPGEVTQTDAHAAESKPRRRRLRLRLCGSPVVYFCLFVFFVQDLSWYICYIVYHGYHDTKYYKTCSCTKTKFSFCINPASGDSYYRPHTDEQGGDADRVHSFWRNKTNREVADFWHEKGNTNGTRNRGVEKVHIDGSKVNISLRTLKPFGTGYRPCSLVL